MLSVVKSIPQKNPSFGTPPDEQQHLLLPPPPRRPPPPLLLVAAIVEVNAAASSALLTETRQLPKGSRSGPSGFFTHLLVGQWH